jgi:hypothetical protein
MGRGKLERIEGSREKEKGKMFWGEIKLMSLRKSKMF